MNEDDYNALEKLASDILDTNMSLYDDEDEVSLGFSIICRKCDNSKAITNYAELVNGESIDILDNTITCEVCGNKLI